MTPEKAAFFAYVRTGTPSAVMQTSRARGVSGPPVVPTRGRPRVGQYNTDVARTPNRFPSQPGRAAVDLPPVIAAVARVGPNTATLAEFTVRPSIAGDGVTLAVRGLIPVPGGAYYRPPQLSRAVVLPEGGAFGSGVEECHRRIEEAVDARSGPVWEALAAECHAVGNKLDCPAAAASTSRRGDSACDAVTRGRRV